MGAGFCCPRRRTYIREYLESEDDEPPARPGLEHFQLSERARLKLRKKVIRALITQDLSELPEELQNMSTLTDITVLYTDDRPARPPTPPGYRARRVQQQPWVLEEA